MATPSRIPVFPSLAQVAYAPLGLPLEPEAAIDKLLVQEPAEASLLIKQIVDPRVITELLTASKRTPFESKYQGARLINVRDTLTEMEIITNARRELFKTNPQLGARVEAEREQNREVDTAQAEKLGAGEANRQFHAKRLLDYCSVLLDIEAFPGGVYDGGEETAKLKDDEVRLRNIVLARHERGYCDTYVEMREGEQRILDVERGTATLRKHAGIHGFPHELASIATSVATRVPFGTTHVGPYEVALSCIRELRFYAHGFVAKAGLETAYVFTGGMTSTSELKDLQMKELFVDIPKLMAPGASILFEGCETGKHAGGTEFMMAAAELFFGKEKWGFVRAHTTETTLIIYPHHGLELNAAKVLEWPRDF